MSSYIYILIYIMHVFVGLFEACGKASRWEISLRLDGSEWEQVGSKE